MQQVEQAKLTKNTLKLSRPKDVTGFFKERTLFSWKIKLHYK
jgi:hypothetical protein